ncbi:hypothetical protein GQ55_4G214600 [Panicum hallii var. hallii]|uniref:Uncharacterized protein n=1 Tax=Panicum hallii var. hallii TaxID=1504633 RepID=A0A2T7DZB1_9POAL|nr:hypothetical protein GQ55_4G214600 [Panicum hallii var. hallii]
MDFGECTNKKAEDKNEVVVDASQQPANDAMDIGEGTDWLHRNDAYACIPVEQQSETTNRDAVVGDVSLELLNVNRPTSKCDLTCVEEFNTPKATHGVVDAMPVTCDKTQVLLTLISVDGKGFELEGCQCQWSRGPL